MVVVPTKTIPQGITAVINLRAGYGSGGERGLHDGGDLPCEDRRGDLCGPRYGHRRQADPPGRLHGNRRRRHPGRGLGYRRCGLRHDRGHDGATTASSSASTTGRTSRRRTPRSSRRGWRSAILPATSSCSTADSPSTTISFLRNKGRIRRGLPGPEQGGITGKYEDSDRIDIH